MKKTILISIVSLFVICGLIRAQDNVPLWMEDTPNATVTVLPKSKIFKVHDYRVSMIKQQRATLNNYLPDFTYPTKGAIKISKGADLPVIGYHRTGRHYDFDIYIVQYQGDYYYVPITSVADNSLIEAKNRQLMDVYSSMLDELARKNDAYTTALKQKSEEVDSMLLMIEDMDRRKKEIIDSTFQARLAVKLSPMQEKYDQWFAGLSASAKKATSIITIESAYLSSPNSAGGCDYNMNFTNRSIKTIKYLYWYGNVYNAVGDKVACEIRGTYSFSGKDTGPIETDKTGGGTWDCIIYNWSAKNLKFTSIKVIYTDGTSVTISAKDANAISDAPRVGLYDFERNTLQSNIRQEVLKEISESRKLWLYRKGLLERWNTENIGFYKEYDFVSDMAVLAEDYMDYSKQVTKFEEDNYFTKP